MYQLLHFNYSDAKLGKVPANYIALLQTLDVCFNARLCLMKRRVESLIGAPVTRELERRVPCYA